MNCRWWNRHGNAKELKNDTGSCMLHYHFGSDVPKTHAMHRQASEFCNFYGQGGEVVTRDYVQEFTAQTAAASLLDRIMIERA